MPAANGSKGKGGLKTDHLKMFQSSVLECKNDPSKGKSWTAVEKHFQELAKLQDVNRLARHHSLIMDLHWVMAESLKTKRSFGHSVLSVLTKVCAASADSTALLRDRLGCPAVLTRAWVECGSNSGDSQTTTKVLELLRHVCYGIRVDREEAFLHDLLQKLLDTMDDQEEKIRALTLTVLASLCHGNHITVKMLLRILSDEQRKAIFVERVDDPIVQLLLCSVHFSLNNASVLSNNRLEEDVASYLHRIWDAVCAAYGEEDCLLLRMMIDFLADLGKDEANAKVLRSCISLTLLQEMFLVVDFTEGCNDDANSLMFRFAKEAVRHHPDPLVVFELVVKTVLLNLESVRRLAHGHDSVQLLKTALERLESQMIDLSESESQNLKLQVDQIVPTLCEILQISEKKLREKVLSVNGHDFEATYLGTLQVISLICGIKEWRDVVSLRLKSPLQALGQFENVILALKRSSSGRYCSVSAVLEIIRLCDRIDWRDVCRDAIVLNDELMVDARECANPKHAKELAMVLLSSDRSSTLLLQAFFERYCADVADCKCLDEARNLTDEDLPIGGCDGYHDHGKVGEVLNNVTRAVEKMTINENLADIMELGDFRLKSQMQQISTLKASLKASDDRIAHTNVLNLQLENEASKLNSLVKKLTRKKQAMEKEMEELRSEHESVESENSHSLRKANEEIATKAEALESLQKNHSKLQTKGAKMKEQLEALQETIREHQRTQSELQEKLRVEGKNNADLTLALAKRDEKLKKKERLLDDEISERERMEKELETLRKECSSLQALTKRQEQVMAKKEKQLQEQDQELVDCRKIQEQIFNLSKNRSSK